MIGYIGILFFSAFMIALLYYSGRVLRKKHEGDIRIIWYFFSLTLVISHIIGFWATGNGAIDASGSFVGGAGAFIEKLITSTLNVELSLYIMAAVVALILLPQFLCYIFSGIFGVAASPIYVGESISFLIWGLIKTFIVVSGVATTILLFGYFLSWKSFNTENIIAWTLISLAFCFFSFITLLLYREYEEMLNDIKKIIPDRLLKILARLHSLFTRHCSNNPINS